MRLIDVSNNNGVAGGSAAIGDPSVGAVYAKATEGLGFKDAVYPSFRKVAKAKRKIFGAYLFLRPDEDGAEQARAFLRYAKPAPGDLQPVVDSETGSPYSAAKTTHAALVELEKHGYKPILYGSSSYLAGLLASAPSLRRFRVWQAEYGPRLHRVRGLNAIAWQFTDRLVVAKGRIRVDGSQVFVRNIKTLQIPAATKLKKPKAKPAATSPAHTGKEKVPAAKKETVRKRSGGGTTKKV